MRISPPTPDSLVLWVAVILPFLHAIAAEPKQRPEDPRLTLIEVGETGWAKLCPGTIHRAANAAEIKALSGKLQPGDQLVLASGKWHDTRLKFTGGGTQERPILIRAEKPGSVVFSGEASASFSGSHLIISGLEFRRVRPVGKGGAILRLDGGHCILHRITIDDCNSTAEVDWPKVRVFYLNLSGPAHTVADCTFANMRNFGQMLAAQTLPPNELLGLHVLDCRFINRPHIDEQNGYEVLQIGWSGEKAKPAGALLRGNVFQHCDGENELITLKASDIIVRENRFLGCQGVLCIRTADRVRVVGNVFDGEDRPNTGGVRIQGADHVIEGNIFRHLRNPSDYYSRTISLMAASGENTADDVEGYGRAKNIRILRNRFEDNDTRIAIGIYPRPNYSLLPRDVRVEDNLFIGGTPAGSVFDYIAPDDTGELRKNLHESGNRFETAGAHLDAGLTEKVLRLVGE